MEELSALIADLAQADLNQALQAELPGVAVDLKLKLLLTDPGSSMRRTWRIARGEVVCLSKS
jgi:hypothetical protein